MNFFKKIPMESCFRRPTCTVTTSKVIHDYWVFVSHLIPAYVVDLGYLLIGKKPRMVNIYNKIHKAMTTLNYFTMRDWQWTRTNLDVMKSHMDPDDLIVSSTNMVTRLLPAFCFMS